MRIKKLALAATVAALTTGTLTAVTPTASAAPAPLKDDYNGDGHRDLAIGTPDANAVTVTFGSASGVGTGRAVTLTQATAGIPGTTEPEDEFGENVTSGDVNHDGYADLIIGAPGERVAGRAGGSVTVVWGGANGFTKGAQVLHAPKADDTRFGEGAVFVDLDGDGSAQLSVVSAENWWWYGDGTPSTGSAYAPEVDFLPEGVTLEGETAAQVHGAGLGKTYTYVLYGTYPDGTPYTGWVDGGAGDIGSRAGTIEGFAGETYATAAVGDVNCDGTPDLVTGQPEDNSVWVFWGGSSIFTDEMEGMDKVTQDSSYVPGVTEPEDRFGASLAVGDVDGDGCADVAVGAPGETVDGVKGTGSVTVLKGHKGTLTAGRAYHQATAGVPGAAEAGDAFGAAVALRDVTGDGRADLAVSATGEDIGTTKDAGAVWVLRGASPYVTTTAATSFNGSAVGLPGKGIKFGTTLR